MNYSHARVIAFFKSIERKSVVKRYHNVAKGQVETYMIRFENEKYIGEIVFWEWGNLSFSLADIATGKISTVDSFQMDGDNYEKAVNDFMVENNFL